MEICHEHLASKQGKQNYSQISDIRKEQKHGRHLKIIHISLIYHKRKFSSRIFIMFFKAYIFVKENRHHENVKSHFQVAESSANTTTFFTAACTRTVIAK